MNENRKKWIEALRSGEYTQTVGALYREKKSGIPLSLHFALDKFSNPDDLKRECSVCAIGLANIITISYETYESVGCTTEQVAKIVYLNDKIGRASCRERV